MRSARSWGDPGDGPVAQKQKQTQHTPASPRLQTHPIAEATLDRMARFRRDLDHWHASGRVDRLPQPADFGLNLAPLDPVEVLWTEGGP